MKLSKMEEWTLKAIEDNKAFHEAEHASFASESWLSVGSSGTENLSWLAHSAIEKVENIYKNQQNCTKWQEDPTAEDHLKVSLLPHEKPWEDMRLQQRGWSIRMAEIHCASANWVLDETIQDIIRMGRTDVLSKSKRPPSIQNCQRFGLSANTACLAKVKLQWDGDVISPYFERPSLQTYDNLQNQDL